MSDQMGDYPPIDSIQVSRRRKPNFTDQEVSTIVDQYDRNKEYLHSREASKSVIAQKQAIWKQITDRLNASYPQVERSVEDVRRKWKKLQSEAKREAVNFQRAKESGSSTALTPKQISLYKKILDICRPSSITSSHFTHQPVDLKHEIREMNDIQFNDESTEKIDSPSSEVQVGPLGQVDSPIDESPNFLLDENSSSPKMNLQNFRQNVENLSNGQVSRRTLEKRRKLLKSSLQNNCSNARTFVQQQNSLRYESLLRRKRSIELTIQRLAFEKDRFILEKKIIEVQLAVNESEQERIQIEKRRVDSSIFKLQNHFSNGTNENNSTNLSENEDHDENLSFDQMSDINE